MVAPDRAAEYEILRRTVSRVLSSRQPFQAPRRRPFLWEARYHTPQAALPGSIGQADLIAPLFGLAPGRVCRAVAVAGDAVGSYPAVSPLPRNPKARGGLLSVALSVVLRRGRLAVSQYPALMEPGLSSRVRF